MNTDNKIEMLKGELSVFVEVVAKILSIVRQ